MSEILGTIWVCTDCVLTHANGECGENPDREPLGEIPDGHSVTLTDEEPVSFSWSSCEGCGSALGGERHALALWRD